MNLAQELLLVIALAMTGLLAILTALIREGRAVHAPFDSPFAASSEGEKLCRRCGMGNLWTDRDCISCGARLPG
jgi:hypothetical protein